MSAAEYNFPNPPDGQLGWLGLAQSVFNQLAGQWDSKTCDGGVRWQMHPWLQGWNYKNIASNGGFFQLGARLALYTGNASYADKAEEVFEWLEKTSPLVTDDYQIFDGTDVAKDCSEPDRTQWTYNYGILIGGAAYVSGFCCFSFLVEIQYEKKTPPMSQFYHKSSCNTTNARLIL